MAAHFPVTNSNLSAAHLGIFLQKKYSLGADTKCTLIRAGINDTYLVVDDESRFIFRVYSFQWRTQAEILEEIKLLKTLKENNISVSYAIPDSHRSFLQILNAPEGDRWGVMFSYAKGDKLHNSPPDTHSRIGGLMANFHKVTSNKTLQRTTYTADVLLTDPLKEIACFLPDDTDEMQFMLTAQKYLLQEFSRCDDDNIRKGTVHLDIWFDNLNISSDGAITIFDFDFCGNGWQCIDVAYYLLQLYWVEPVEANYKATSAAFLNGYESVTALSREEKSILPMLGVSMYFFYLGVQCRRFDDFSNVFMSETYLKRFISQRVKKYYDYHCLG